VGQAGWAGLTVHEHSREALNWALELDLECRTDQTHESSWRNSRGREVWDSRRFSAESCRESPISPVIRRCDGSKPPASAL
jgi:hypothetical protein